MATCLIGSSVFCSCSKEDHDYVDLGLPSGTLWATCNVGANSPEEYGDYFAWGETAPKSDYSWSTYKYFKSPEEIITKYWDSEHGTLDIKDLDTAVANILKLVYSFKENKINIEEYLNNYSIIKENFNTIELFNNNFFISPVLK